MRIYKTYNYLIQIVLFLTFLGFYSILLLGHSLGMSEFTRQLTIPMRIVVVISCLLLFMLNYRKRSPYLIWFIAFVGIYSLRILLDINSLEWFYISYNELVLYFLSFCVITFIGVSKVPFSTINVDKLYKVFLLSALLFSSLSIIFYGQYIGQVYRLSTSSAGVNVISPLILSYCSALIIGVSLTYMIFNKTKLHIKLLNLAAIIMSVIPFFLGASRGSIIAVFVPLFMLALANMSLKNFFKYTILFAVLVFGLVYMDNYFESGLLSRFLSTSEAIETGGSSASRIDIWKSSFSQFLNHPFMGDKLNTEGVNHYPHNIFLEVLQTTGVIGFIPFIVLFVKGVIASFKIFKHHAEYAWISVIFLQASMQNMFSGAVYTAAWYWTSLAMVLALYQFLKLRTL